jgi:type IV pilus assembly protein PilV
MTTNAPQYPVARINFATEGFSLVEVLVSLAVLSIGLLGLAIMQTLALTAGQGGYLRTQAVILAYDLIDRARANTLAYSAGEYDPATFPAGNPPVDCAAAACSPSDLATYDLIKWKKNVTDLLPNGSVDVDAIGGNYTITITWDDRSNRDTTAVLSQQFTITARII